MSTVCTVGGHICLRQSSSNRPVQCLGRGCGGTGEPSRTGMSGKVSCLEDNAKGGWKFMQGKSVPLVRQVLQHPGRGGQGAGAWSSQQLIVSGERGRSIIGFS